MGKDFLMGGLSLPIKKSLHQYHYPLDKSCPR